MPVNGRSWEFNVSEDSGPRPWWYIPESGIYHQPKLTQPRPCRAGISSATGGGSATRLHSPDA